MLQVCTLKPLSAVMVPVALMLPDTDSLSPEAGALVPMPTLPSTARPLAGAVLVVAQVPPMTCAPFTSSMFLMVVVPVTPMPTFVVEAVVRMPVLVLPLGAQLSARAGPAAHRPVMAMARAQLMREQVRMESMAVSLVVEKAVTAVT